MRSAPYLAIVHSICDLEPRYGWVSPLEIPLLSPEDADVVAQEYPEEVQEGIDESLRLTVLREYLRAGDFMFVGIKYAAAMREAARHVVWHDVQEESERRESYRAADWDERHPETPEAAHGVGRSFL